MTSLINPLKIATQTFETPLVQGPLAGISSAPFRRLVSRISRPAFTYTEMISCETLVNGRKNNHRFLARDPDEGPVCYQLSGKKPEILAEAVKIVTDRGADFIDLNCGCPVKKIRSRHAGSKHLANPQHLAKLIKAMKDNTHLPISIKVRVDGDSGDQFNRDILTVINDSGLDFVAVHGRHWTEKYDIPCRYDQIQLFVDSLGIPVIGNGDIRCIRSLTDLLNTGCQGAMIARAGVGQPWLIAQLMADLKGEHYALPKPSEVASWFIEHVESLAELLESERFAVIQARKFSKYYARSITNQTEFVQAMNQCQNLKQMRTLCATYFS